MNVYPFIAAEHAGTHNIKRACELLEVSRSAYYQHRRGLPSARRRVDAQLVEKITQSHAVSKGTYGAPRVHADLTDAGLRHGRKRVARLMRAAGLAGKSPRRWRTTTIPDPHAGKRPDLVNRDFSPDPAAVDTRWCGDITYINTWQGWLYLATVIDLASRRIVGWAVADNLKTDLVDAALIDALARRRPASGLVFHSDRGCQYTSAQHARLAAAHDILLSVGRRGQCWDNAVAESFFSTIKTELLHRQSWPTHDAARQAIFEYIEGWYNTRRRHSSLGYLSPATFEITGLPPSAINQAA